MVSAKTLPTIPTLLSLVGACVEWAHYLPQRENNDEQGPFFHLELGETFGVSPPCPTELGGRNVQWLEAGGAQPLGWWCIASGTRKISYQLLSLDLGRCLRVFPDAAEPRSIFQENSGRAHPLFQGMGALTAESPTTLGDTRFSVASNSQHRMMRPVFLLRSCFWHFSCFLQSSKRFLVTFF